MNNIDDGTGKKETRLKLIRSESISVYAWDASELSVNGGYGVNEWSQADLMKLLNPGYEEESVGGSLYYNNNSGVCYYAGLNETAACDFTSRGLKSSLKKLINNTLWNTGTNGENDPNISEDVLVNNFYKYERSDNTGKICTAGNYCNDTVERTTTWQGKVGLMYASDYGYATSGGNTSNRTNCLNKSLLNWNDNSNNDCKDNNWLYFSEDQLTLSVCSSSMAASCVFRLNLEGNVYGNFSGHGGFVHPSVYLKSNVSILSDEGTPENPYGLG